MTVIVDTAPVTSPPDRYGGDPEAFDAAMQSHINWQVDIIPQANAQNVENNSINANINAQTAALMAAGLANAAANASAAQAAAAAAVISASLAQATNPDAPIRLNPRTITADTTITSAYNATSTGPITIADGITVTVQDGATYLIQ